MGRQEQLNAVKWAIKLLSGGWYCQCDWHSVDAGRIKDRLEHAFGLEKKPKPVKLTRLQKRMLEDAKLLSVKA